MKCKVNTKPGKASERLNPTVRTRKIGGRKKPVTGMLESQGY